MRNYRKLKIDKLARDIFRKLDSFNARHEEVNDSHDNYEDDYYLRINEVPPRFELYRQAKLEKLGELDQLTYEGIDHTITLDELNFGLKRELAMTPEQRYLRKKVNFLYHLKDCHFGSVVSECKPECRLYHETGRIDDSEVIDEHNRLVDKLNQENRIVDPPSEEELLRLSKLINSDL